MEGRGEWLDDDCYLASVERRHDERNKEIDYVSSRLWLPTTDVSFRMPTILFINMLLHNEADFTPLASTSSAWHWGYVGYLARELDAEVVVVPYPLAPTNNGLETMPVLTQVYKGFLSRVNGRETIVAGDRCVFLTKTGLRTMLLRLVCSSRAASPSNIRMRSAGATLALCLAFAAHDAGLAHIAGCRPQDGQP